MTTLSEVVQGYIKHYAFCLYFQGVSEDGKNLLFVCVKAGGEHPLGAHVQKPIEDIKHRYCSDCNGDASETFDELTPACDEHGGYWRGCA